MSASNYVQLSILFLTAQNIYPYNSYVLYTLCTSVTVYQIYFPVLSSKTLFFPVLFFHPLYLLLLFLPYVESSRDRSYASFASEHFYPDPTHGSSSRMFYELERGRSGYSPPVHHYGNHNNNSNNAVSRPDYAQYEDSSFWSRHQPLVDAAFSDILAPTSPER